MGPPCELVHRGQETSPPDGLEVSAVGRRGQQVLPVFSGLSTLVRLCLLPLAEVTATLKQPVEGFGEDES